VKQFNGLLKPSKGKVIVGGVNTRDISIAQLARKVGFVFQNPDHQLFSETVEEEVGYALKNFGFNNEAIDKRVKWALNLLNLREYRKTSPFMLSRLLHGILKSLFLTSLRLDRITYRRKLYVSSLSNLNPKARLWLLSHMI
jgi:ABC-type transporter Mla maintaining outer membrane lipid asymmetry ATPase subunit MlaF